MDRILKRAMRVSIVVEFMLTTFSVQLSKVLRVDEDAFTCFMIYRVRLLGFWFDQLSVAAFTLHSGRVSQLSRFSLFGFAVY